VNCLIVLFLFLIVVQSPRRSRHLRGLDPLTSQSEADTPLASRPISINPSKIDRESTSDSGIEVRNEDNPFSSPILDSSGYYPVGPFIPDIASLDYSSFSFEPYTPVIIDDLSLEADRLSVNQGPT